MCSKRRNIGKTGQVDQWIPHSERTKDLCLLPVSSCIRVRCNNYKMFFVLEVSFLCVQVTSMLYPSCHSAKWVETYEQREHRKHDTSVPHGEYRTVDNRSTVLKPSEVQALRSNKYCTAKRKKC